ncbi:MAG: helix-turn-helix transcriptional regulator, partial [Bacteroidota bacterium]
ILGCGVHDYIIDYRIKEARKLLEDKDLSIKEIAYRTGFTSPSYFSTIFKSKMNVSPTNYRSSL